MHRFIIATAVLLLAPATALAVTTGQAQPVKISISGTGAPKCTKLPYNVLSVRHKVILRITRSTKASAKAVKHIRLRNVPAGNHDFTWCGHDDITHQVKPGTYYWRVGATAKAGSTVVWSVFRHVIVTA
jgi:flagellar hook assembly protein FlgD